jgi:hypothetical protein
LADAAAPEDGVPVAVVPGALLRVRERLVGLLELGKVGRRLSYPMLVLI